MNLQNIAIRSPGDLNKERLVMRALTDLDVGAYTIFAVVGREGVPTNDLRHAFWFPDLSVKKNDLVVVYTKVGKHKKKLNDNGTESYFFYWDLEQTLWDDYVAIIGMIKEWNTF